MSKILVIPDVHLKPYIFDYAEKIINSNEVDNIVFVGDLVDDWNQDNNLDLYKQTIDRAIKFKQDYPNSLFCWGNHEIGYYAKWHCSGNSKLHKFDIIELLNKYQSIVEPKYVHVIDDILFSHGGIDSYKISSMEERFNKLFDIHEIAEIYNQQSIEQMGDSESPIWLRPALWSTYYSRFTQIVGHTPVKRISYYNNTWFTDTFSTMSNGKKFCHESMIIFDTQKYKVQIFSCKTDTPKLIDTIGRMHWNKYDINGD